MILILCSFELNHLLSEELFKVTNVFSFNPFGVIVVTTILLVEVLHHIL